MQEIARATGIYGTFVDVEHGALAAISDSAGPRGAAGLRSGPAQRRHCILISSRSRAAQVFPDKGVLINDAR